MAFYRILLIILLFLQAPVFAANMNIIKCGGYVGYDEKFIYLNWQADKKEFRDKISIREREAINILWLLCLLQTK